jgi:hypothetical protein
MDIGEKWKFKVLDFERLEMDAGEQFWNWYKKKIFW